MADGLVVSSKFEQMRDILKAGIVRGEFGVGDRIASENELSAQYGISRNTVREAVGTLVQEGYLSREQGRGTFVRNRPPTAPATDTYAIFIHAHGHVFEAQTRALVQVFQAQGAFPLVFDVEAFQSEARTESLLEKLLEERVSGMVIEELDLLRRLQAVSRRTGKPLPMLAVLNAAFPDEHGPAKTVVSDFYAGLQLGARHLLGLGRRRILFVIHKNLFAHKGEAPEAMVGLYGEICRGYADAMREAGLEPRYFIHESEFRAGSADRARFQTALTGPDRPDAVLVFGDYVAKEVLALAGEAGLRVPDDLAMVGYWNTPWAEMTRPPLTSVSICEDEIARLAAEKLIESRKSGDMTPETTVIPPRLVVRQSCGAKVSNRKKET